MEFKYFKDPLNFAVFKNSAQPCSLCEDEGIWFNANSYVGVEEIDCICVRCLKSGSLIELGIEANQAFNDGSDSAITVIYKTPALPTWQDISWPIIDGEFAVFEKIGSKLDFESEEHFLTSYIGSNRNKIDLVRLWDALPEKALINYKEARDVSVYIFTSETRRFWLWDES